MQGNVVREKENVALERLMDRAVEEVRADIRANPNAFLDSMARWQQSERRARREAEALHAVKLRGAAASGACFRLQCRKCRAEACLSTDLRRIEDSPNAVVGGRFTDKWIRVEIDEVQHYKRNMEKTASLVCKNCSRAWGSLNTYTPTGREFPLLKLENFVLVNATTERVIKKKLKWSEVPFCVDDISDEELAGL